MSKSIFKKSMAAEIMSHEKNIKILYLLIPFMDIGEKIRREWESYNRFAHLSVYPRFSSINVELFLGKEDSIKKDIGPIIEELNNNPELDRNGSYICPEMKYKNWSFRWTKGNCFVYLNIYAYYGDSNKCRSVGTGKMVEEQKLVCDDE